MVTRAARSAEPAIVPGPSVIFCRFIAVCLFSTLCGTQGADCVIGKVPDGTYRASPASPFALVGKVLLDEAALRTVASLPGSNSEIVAGRDPLFCGFRRKKKNRGSGRRSWLQAQVSPGTVRPVIPRIPML